VVISRGGLANYLGECLRRYDVERGQGTLVASPVGFDLTVTALLSPLLVGGRVELLPEEEGVEGLLAALARSRDLSLVKLTPAHMELLARRHEETDLASATRMLILGGEALHGESLAWWRRAAPATRLINEYGPTEAVVGCCVHEVPPGPLDPGPVPIGRPLGNARLYLLARGLRPLPAEVPDELFIGGEGLARGYLGRPGLTAEKFIPDPFADRPGSRLYATGDLARRRADGVLEYIGRTDQQVKVRGYRVELGEVEAGIARHPAIREAAVVADGEGPGDRRLLAFAVANGSPPSTEELRSFLSQRLPEPMVPAVVTFLPSLPLTPNGKVDRTALAQLDPGRPDLGQKYVAPRTPVEEVLAGIWAEVLRLDAIGVRDNFFDLGGHSLVATQISSRLRRVFDVEVPAGALFDAPTVAELARRVDRAMGGRDRAGEEAIEAVARHGDLPLSFAQQRLWFLDQLDAGNALYNIPSSLRLSGRPELAALRRAVDEIVGRHETLRTTFPARAGRPQLTIAPPRRQELPLVDLSGLDDGDREGEVERLGRREAWRPFDLSRGPLLRTGLLRLGEEEHILLFTIHHIVCDGWSMGVLLREWVELYGAFVRHRPSPLPDLTVQYGDFAHWQRRWFLGKVREAQISYWRQKLAGLPPVLELPFDKPRPEVRTFRGDSRIVRLEAPLWQALRRSSRGAGVTPFIALVAVFQTLLHFWSGRDDVFVGTDVANRNRIEVEPLIGFFVNQLVLRTDFSGADSFSEVLQRVRQVVLGAHAHEDLPFEDLLEILGTQRRLDHAPVFQVKVFQQNAPTVAEQLPGLSVRALRVEDPTAKLDLTLAISETAEGLGCSFNYNTELFYRSTIERLADQFEALLSHVVEHPAAAMEDLRRVFREVEEQHRSALRKQRRRSRVERWQSVRNEGPAAPSQVDPADNHQA
jgi:non-ribosomal peptide synthetase component F/acyl carrier protein